MINLYKELRGFKTVESAGNFGLGGGGRQPKSKNQNS